MLYHILSHVQFGNPYQLQKYIDNRNGDKIIGLKSITYWIGWYNIKETQEIYVNNKVAATIEPGLYSFNDIKKVFDDEASVKLYMNKNSGIATLLIPEHTTVGITAGLVSVLGFEGMDAMLGMSGFIYDPLKNLIFSRRDKQLRYRGNKSIDFAVPKELRVCLDQLNTETNYFNGAPSTILEVLPAPAEGYGSVVSTRFEIPSFKQLKDGCITELSVCLKDENNTLLKNNGHHITVELCIK